MLENKNNLGEISVNENERPRQGSEQKEKKKVQIRLVPVTGRHSIISSAG